MGVTEPLYTHTFYEPATFALTTDDRTWSVSNDARLDGGTHFITMTEEEYPGYYDVFEHVFEAMVASFEGVPVVEASRGFDDDGRPSLYCDLRAKLSSKNPNMWAMGSEKRNDAPGDMTMWNLS